MADDKIAEPPVFRPATGPVAESRLFRPVDWGCHTLHNATRFPCAKAAATPQVAISHFLGRCSP